MKIVVNARLMRRDRLDGIGRFTFHTLQWMVQQHPEVAFYLLVSREEDRALINGANVQSLVLLPAPRHPLLHFVWLEWSVHRLLKRIQPDLFLSMDGMLVCGWKGRQLPVIHDINFLHDPKGLRFSDRLFNNYFYPRYARQGTRIATVSAFSRQDIATHYHIPEDQIDVVYNGISEVFEPVDEATKAETRLRYTNGKPYFFFLGSLSPRKNISALLDAYELYRLNGGPEVHLVITGESIYQSAVLHQYKQRMYCGADVHFTGRVDDAELNMLMGASLALVYVSSFEGFGIPLLEAMQCGVPVIASNVTAIPEVTGDAALLVNPQSVQDIALAMLQLAIDEALRYELIRKGNLRKALFSWEKTSMLLWESIEKAISQ